MEEITPEGQPAEGQAPAETPEGGGETYQVPEKFQGATPEETIAKMGKSYTELEKKLSEGNKTPAEIGEIKKTLTELREAILSKKEPVEDDVAAQNTRNYLKSIGVPTMEDLEKAQEQGRKDYELSRMNSDLAKKYDGKDGRPVYNGQEIATYAKENGMSQLPPETVYKLKHEAELRDWDIKQALKGNRAPAVPGQGKGAQQSSGPDMSKMKPDEVEAIARENALKRIQAQESV